MKLIFLRHGTASPKSKDPSGSGDFRRELIRSGRKEVKRLLKKHPGIFKNIDVIFSSPLVRAVQTAELLYRKYKSEKFEILSGLDKAESPENFISGLKIRQDETVCFVGHEPHLTESVKLLLHSPELQISLKKGGALVLGGSSLKSLRLTAIV